MVEKLHTTYKHHCNRVWEWDNELTANTSARCMTAAIPLCLDAVLSVA